MPILCPKPDGHSLKGISARDTRPRIPVDSTANQSTLLPSHAASGGGLSQLDKARTAVLRLWTKGVSQRLAAGIGHVRCRPSTRMAQPNINHIRLTNSVIPMQQINDEFRHVCGDVKLWSFSEAIPTTFGLTSSMVVEKDSAILSQSGHHEHLLPVHFTIPLHPYREILASVSQSSLY